MGKDVPAIDYLSKLLEESLGGREYFMLFETKDAAERVAVALEGLTLTPTP